MTGAGAPVPSTVHAPCGAGTSQEAPPGQARTPVRGGAELGGGQDARE